MTARPRVAENKEGLGPTPGVWVLNRKKLLVMQSACDPQGSEKVGSLSSKMPVRILEKREFTQPDGGLMIRAYVSTLPSQSSVLLTIALNEFNHSPQRFPSVAEYDAALPLRGGVR